MTRPDPSPRKRILLTNPSPTMAAAVDFSDILVLLKPGASVAVERSEEDILHRGVTDG